MNKTYQFRLYPTKKQQATLNKWLALCCDVYNAALQERRDAYRMAGVSLGFAHLILLASGTSWLKLGACSWGRFRPVCCKLGILSRLSQGILVGYNQPGHRATLFKNI